MPKFAIYFVPPAESPFYQLGTHVLGYDVRGRTSATMPPGLEADFGRFDAAWTAIARPFGFHLTVCDALDCDWATIPVVERELVDLFSCFDPATEFALQRDAEKPVGIWGSAGRVLPSVAVSAEYLAFHAARRTHQSAGQRIRVSTPIPGRISDTTAAPSPAGAVVL
jgi:hypothetical protein